MRTKIGIDLGSRSIKIAILGKSGQPELFDYDSTQFYDEFGHASENGFVLDLDKFGADKDSLVFATGYGRNALSIANAEVVPEIQAHTSGAVYQTGIQDFTLIDLGGQDSKVITVREGKVHDFYMNDRCAASAGRYIENMAKILGMSLSKISTYFEDPEPLSATCAVFGESELVAKIAKGISKEHLAAGVNAQIIQRIAGPLSSRTPTRIVLVGGVARNSAISKLLAMKYYVPVIIPKYPQHNAAIGLLYKSDN
jgi:predicted CoA-substrate-specific enzyme activase